MLCLVARFKDDVLRYPIPAKDSLIGSSADNHLLLPFPGVSRTHARVRPVDGDIAVFHPHVAGRVIYLGHGAKAPSPAGWFRRSARDRSTCRTDASAPRRDGSGGVSDAG